MKFFSDLHQAIFEPLFYVEVCSATRMRIAGFLLRLFVLSVLISTVFKVYYILDDDRGVAQPLSVIFSDMEIRNGELIPNRSLPYVPPANLISEVLERMAGFNGLAPAVGDTFLVVDTLVHNWEGKRRPSVVMGSHHLTLQPSTDFERRIAYETLAGDTEHFIFNQSMLQKLLLEIIPILFFNALIWCMVFTFMIMVTSIFFLGLAAYLFRFDRARSLWQFFKIACFASSPVVLGNTIVSISGVKIDLLWHVFIFISSIVMFRAITATQIKLKNSEKDSE